MVYPYSQEDIPPLRYQSQQQSRPQSHRHTITKTHVQIQPSQGYEIKEEPAQYYPVGNQQQYQQQQPQQQYQLPNYHYQQQQPQGPVIVLRIPGPAKYATHLQALLQQYLEIRAAQYIEALQEQEAAGQPHNVQSTVPQQEATPEYQAPMYLPNNEASTTSLRNTGPHQYPTSPQPTSFKVTPSHIFHQQQQQQQLKQLQQQQHQREIEQQQQHIQHQQQSQQVYPAPAIYEEHQVEVSPAPQYQDSEVQVHVQGEVEYQQQPEQYAQQQAYESAHQQQHQQIEHQQQEHQQQAHQQQEHQQQEQQQGYQYEVPDHSGLQTNENFPSQHHTQVIFRKNQQQQHQSHQQQQIQEQQPQIVYDQQAQPEQQYYEESAATAAPQYHQQSHFYQPHEVEFTASSHEAVSITPKAPFGFHPHEIESTSASPSKRAAPFSEQQFNKFNKLITKLKKKSAELKAARAE